LLDADYPDVGFALRAGEIHARLHALIPTQKSLKKFCAAVQSVHRN
jgi:hypothetical protein